MFNKIIGFPVMTLFLTACVTINIYFPAAAAEEAARTIVRDVLGKEPAPPAAPDQPDAQPPKDEGSGAVEQLRDTSVAAVGWVLETLVSPAQAAKANIDINTPVISRLRKSMATRQRALRPFYRSGAIGFDQRGLVAVRDLGAVPLPKRGKLRGLVADENRDRNALYREIARANDHPEWEKDIRRTFARVWVDEAASGYWYKTKGGKWRQK